MLDTPRANLPIGTATARWPQRHLLDVDQLDRDAIPAAWIWPWRCARCASVGSGWTSWPATPSAWPSPSPPPGPGSASRWPPPRGAQVLALPMEASSTTKGESLVDTLLTLERTGIDTIVLRHGASGAPYLAARATGLRIVNAGDGTHAHPTQALLDALTCATHWAGWTGR